jgi:heme-degrading monooxygenase HmoA
VITLAELDPAAPYAAQLREEAGPVVLVNTFVAPDGRMDEVVAAWAEDARYFRSRSGYVSTQLHRGIGASHVLVNIAIWESVEHLRSAFLDEEFRSHMARYPDGTTATPHVLQKVAVEGICVA